MRKPQLSAFNLVQLVITVVAVMFGVYGFINVGDAPANAPVVANLACGDGPLAGGGCSPLEMPDRPAPRPNTPPVNVDIPEQPGDFDPEDTGNGSLKGTVKFSDGRGVEGMKITAISTSVEPAMPQWDQEDIVKTHKDYDRYFRELERNTRVTFTDATGRFDLSGLDESHSYRVTASNPEVGQSQQIARSGGRVDFQFEVPVVLDGVVSCEGGKLPGQWSVTVSADTGQGWFDYVASATFSDSEGKFRIRAKLGKVKVAVFAQGWVQDKFDTIELTAEGGSARVTMVKAAVLSGTVTSTDGNPMPNVTVYVSGQGGEVPIGGGYYPERAWGLRDDMDRAEEAVIIGKRLKVEEAVKTLEEAVVDEEWIGGGWGNLTGYTDASGKYRIEGLRPGTVTVTATMGSITASREITLAGGENYADFSLDAGCRVKIVGKDTRNNAVTPQYAWFVSAEGQYAECVQLPAGTPGELEYMGLKEGTWNMTVQAQGFPAVTQEVRVGRGSNTFDVVFQAPASLKGKVSSSGGQVPQNCYVRLTPVSQDKNIEEKKRRAYSEGGQYYAIDAQGNYKAENLQPGDYKLSVEFNQYDSLYQQDVRLDAGEDEMDITVDERCTLTVTLDLAPELTNKEGISVSLSKTSKEGGYVSRYAQLEKGGSVTFAFLPEGDYYAAAYAQDGTQSYLTVTVNRGSNAVSLSLGPPNCVKITQVAEGYQAAEAGVQVGDLIIEYNGVSIGNMETLIKEVQSTSESDSVSLVVIRNGSTTSFRLKGGRMGINGDNFRR
ncbi:MAG: carboxypeptidase regulatory-like domain-containing protein [Planctomycetes bacterium]|nr:carboxypeptidase regulatory-like domain-containing protein [Planctomycetota bacterium]MCB9936182.1 carboxypeptidase regulatory-like domain-containing protein [Planctomycetota bacterium]